MCHFACGLSEICVPRPLPLHLLRDKMMGGSKFLSPIVCTYQYYAYLCAVIEGMPNWLSW